MNGFPLTIEQEFHLYKKDVTANPDTIDFYVPLPNRQNPERMIQFHYCGKETYGAVFDIRGNFRSFIPRVALN